MRLMTSESNGFVCVIFARFIEIAQQKDKCYNVTLGCLSVSQTARPSVHPSDCHILKSQRWIISHYLFLIHFTQTTDMPSLLTYFPLKRYFCAYHPLFFCSCPSCSIGRLSFSCTIILLFANIYIIWIHISCLFI